MDQTRLVQDFVSFQRITGKRSLRKLPYELAPLFRYLGEQGLTFTDVNYSRAQGFQSWLVSRENEDGSSHYAARSVADIMAAVRCFYDYLKHQGITGTNPFTDVVRIRIPQAIPRNLPDEATMNRILDYLARFHEQLVLRDRRSVYRLHVAAEVLYASGVRVSELAGLEPQDIDLEA